MASIARFVIVPRMTPNPKRNHRGTTVTEISGDHWKALSARKSNKTRDFQPRETDRKLNKNAAVKLWIRRSVVRVHRAVPDKLAKYLEIFDAPIVMHFASWWGSTREALRKLGLRHLQKRPIDSLRLVSAAGPISRGRPRDRSSQFVRRIPFAFDRITSIDAFAIAWAKRTSVG